MPAQFQRPNSAKVGLCLQFGHNLDAVQVFQEPGGLALLRNAPPASDFEKLTPVGRRHFAPRSACH
jgi:hypothetical protein